MPFSLNLASIQDVNRQISQTLPQIRPQIIQSNPVPLSADEAIAMIESAPLKLIARESGVRADRADCLFTNGVVTVLKEYCWKEKDVQASALLVHVPGRGYLRIYEEFGSADALEEFAGIAKQQYRAVVAQLKSVHGEGFESAWARMSPEQRVDQMRIGALWDELEGVKARFSMSELEGLVRSPSFQAELRSRPQEEVAPAQILSRYESLRGEVREAWLRGESSTQIEARIAPLWGLRFLPASVKRLSLKATKSSVFLAELAERLPDADQRIRAHVWRTVTSHSMDWRPETEGEAAPDLSDRRTAHAKFKEAAEGEILPWCTMALSSAVDRPQMGCPASFGEATRAAWKKIGETYPSGPNYSPERWRSLHERLRLMVYPPVASKPASHPVAPRRR